MSPDRDPSLPLWLAVINKNEAGLKRSVISTSAGLGMFPHIPSSKMLCKKFHYPEASILWGSPSYCVERERPRGEAARCQKCEWRVLGPSSRSRFLAEWMTPTDTFWSNSFILLSAAHIHHPQNCEESHGRCFKPLNSGAVCYTAADKQNVRLAWLQQLVAYRKPRG